MLVIEDTDFDDAVQQLQSAGFQDWPWSYGAQCPDFYNGPMRERIYRRIVHEYSSLDKNSTRFLFPTEQQETAPISTCGQSPTYMETLCLVMIPRTLAMMKQLPFGSVRILRQGGNGIDRVTCTKRLGRVGYDERLVMRDMAKCNFRICRDKKKIMIVAAND
ncbi:hypothetical protein V8C35DRAFT_315265 [Trichoderma chlorosporum]